MQIFGDWDEYEEVRSHLLVTTRKVIQRGVVSIWVSLDEYEGELVISLSEVDNMLSPSSYACSANDVQGLPRNLLARTGALVLARTTKTAPIIALHISVCIFTSGNAS